MIAMTEAKPKTMHKHSFQARKARALYHDTVPGAQAVPGMTSSSLEEIITATNQWKQRILSEPDLFKPELPLNMVYQDPNYLDPGLRVRVATEVKGTLRRMRRELDTDGSRYIYTLHDPSFTKVPLNRILATVDQHTRLIGLKPLKSQLISLDLIEINIRFQIFLSSLFYIGTGKDDRDSSHTTQQANRNPKKMDLVEDIQAKGCEVMVHRFSRGLNREQGRYLEALALRSTRLGGRLVNLKEERPKGSTQDSIEQQMLMGALVLWEGSRTFGRQSSQVET